MDSPSPAPASDFLVNKQRVRVLGLSFDDAVKIFFGGNALMSVVVLTLITYFSFQEGFGFFRQNHANLLTYRQAGLEYVDYIRTQESAHTALTRYLSDLRLRQFNYLTTTGKLTPAAANLSLARYDEFAANYGDTVEPVRGLVSELTEQATAIKTKFSSPRIKKSSGSNCSPRVSPRPPPR